MTDIVSPSTRSKMMAGIRSKNTKIEIALRKSLFVRGFRYRINVINLPGKPDMVFPKYNAVIMVHGCFWHGHDCHLFKIPHSNQEFWINKIRRNQQNDTSVSFSLIKLGWRVLTVWECSTRGPKCIGLEEVTNLTEKWLLSNSFSLEIRS